MVQFKEFAFSDRGMKVVNTIFFLSVFIRNQGLILAAYFAWIAYLAAGMKNTSSRAVKAVYSVFVFYAAVIIAVNLCAMLQFI